tara:strand:+ start:143573 stop:144154 length:582 start_codon:yes stop_codon:yes gene_type:complete
MRNPPHITGLILAGGAGRRTGGSDKGLLQWRGKPLVEHVAQCLQQQVDRLLVSCNRNIARYEALGFTTVVDKRADFQGPLAGLEAAAKEITGDVIVIAPCDNPTLPSDIVSRLLQPLLNDPGVGISYVNDGHRDHYLNAAIRLSCLDGLESYLDAGGRTVRHWYALHHSVAVDFSDTPFFPNLNSLTGEFPET